MSPDEVDALLVGVLMGIVAWAVLSSHGIWIQLVGAVAAFILFARLMVAIR